MLQKLLLFPTGNPSDLSPDRTTNPYTILFPVQTQFTILILKSCLKTISQNLTDR